MFAVPWQEYKFSPFGMLYVEKSLEEKERVREFG